MHLTGNTSHELGLGVWGGLEMHAANRAALGVVREIALGEAGRQTMCGEFLATPRAGEPAAVVLVAFQLDDEYAGYFCLGKFHLYQPHLGDGNQEFPARVAVRLLLHEDFIREIPRQQ